MKKWLQFILLFYTGVLLISTSVGCGNADAQKQIDSSSFVSDPAIDPGQDGNPATYDQDPDNLPQSLLRTYDNADGREVQNPTAYIAPPPNASAICRNGEYSFSKRRCGSCSGNGGVKVWLRTDLPKC